MTPEQELARAAEAQFVLANGLFKEACSAIEQAIFNGIKLSALKDQDLRERLCQQYVLLQTLLDQLRTHMETGKLAEETIRRRTISERVKAALY